MKTTGPTAIRNLAIGIGSMLVIAGAPAFGMEHGATDHGAMDHAHMEKSAQVAMTDGEIRKIDTELGKVTIKHGEIKNLEMPAMTMVYTVKDKALLSGLKVGEKIRFTATKENGKLMVTAMEPSSVK